MISCLNIFGDVEDSIRRLERANVERYEEEVLTTSRANIDPKTQYSIIPAHQTV